MKKGKTVKLNGYKSFKSSYGTIDSTNLKSIFINIQTWVEPKEDFENWNRVILNMTRKFKHSTIMRCYAKRPLHRSTCRRC